jgi:hypothetical protein
MKFPGSKLLHRVDLTGQGLALDDVLRSCRQVGLTGFAEISVGESVGMIFYYLGGEVNALFRERSVAYNGQRAIDRLREGSQELDCAVAVYELPLDIAHLLRGITNRRQLKERLCSKDELEALLQRLEDTEHTGTLEIHTPTGGAMILLVQGRTSNVYWETREGVTFEKGEARTRLERALDNGTTQLVLAEFSPQVWKARQEIEAQSESRVGPARQPGASTELLALEETSQRKRALDELHAAVPSLLQALFFDLLTGAIFVRKVRGSSALRVGVLADRLPSLLLDVRDVVASSNDDHIETFELTTNQAVAVAGVVAETQEAIALIADKSQPTALIHAAVSRCIRDYLATIRPTRNVARA